MTGGNRRKEPKELDEWRDRESLLRELQKEVGPEWKGS